METDNDATQMIEGSDFYIINIDGSGRVQITDTPDKIEMDPEWSPDGSKIAYWTDISHRRGEIWVIKLK
jgi:Tol biopolymer transport system component